MSVNASDGFTIAFSDAPPALLAKLEAIAAKHKEASFFEFVRLQWEARAEEGAMGWSTLMDGEFLLRALTYPEVLTLPHAIDLTRLALAEDTLFDTKLMRHILNHPLWPDQFPVSRIMRTLEILDDFDEPHRLAMPLLKLSKFPDNHIQSKVAKILGRVIDSPEVIEELFQNEDSRVRANLLEGIARRDDFAVFLPMIERAAQDPSTRVSSLALALRARAGHAGAGALIKIRSKAPLPQIRRSAEFANRIANGETAYPQEVLNPDLASLARAVDAEPAMAAPIEEVHSQSDSHPENQP